MSAIQFSTSPSGFTFPSADRAKFFIEKSWFLEHHRGGIYDCCSIIKVELLDERMIFLLIDLGFWEKAMLIFKKSQFIVLFLALVTQLINIFPFSTGTKN